MNGEVTSSHPPGWSSVEWSTALAEEAVTTADTFHSSAAPFYQAGILSSPHCCVYIWRRWSCFSDLSHEMFHCLKHQSLLAAVSMTILGWPRVKELQPSLATSQLWRTSGPYHVISFNWDSPLINTSFANRALLHYFLSLCLLVGNRLLSLWLPWCLSFCQCTMYKS